jgi:L-threonylcarbamoyladenylate synthase
MIVQPTDQAIAAAVTILKQGELVALPTETVYGLGADASNVEAVAKIFAAKGRPTNHPVIVHLDSLDALETWARDISPLAFKLAETFWPGPMTLILKRSNRTPDIVTAGQNTVGLRVPSHPIALKLLSAFGAGIAAPSANRFGCISPTVAKHVEAELGDSVKLILDGGECQVGLESTIIDAISPEFRILRPGGLSRETVAEVLGYLPEVVTKAEVRVSGALESHYAPCTPTFLVPESDLAGVGDNGVIAFREKPLQFSGVWLQLPRDAIAYGQQLYAALRHLDQMGLNRIYVEAVPKTPEWLAVQDRLNRATARPGIPAV